jgi:two-component system nitrate/nitrite sensor histidine kinase NarQ
MPHLHLVAREAMVNAVKHSGATRIDVSMHCTVGSELRLEVRDNGRGMMGSKGAGGGMGIGIMEYRAAKIGGRLEITDANGGGTSVVCTVPCTGTSFTEVADG